MMNGGCDPTWKDGRLWTFVGFAFGGNWKVLVLWDPETLVRDRNTALGSS